MQNNYDCEFANVNIYLYICGLLFTKFSFNNSLIMVDRIKKIIDKEGLNSASFADKIGVSRGTITHVLTGRNEPSLKVIQKIRETFPNINVDWLLSGTNPMYNHEKIYLKPQQESIEFDKEIQTLNPPKNEVYAPSEPKIPEYPPKNIDKASVEHPQPIRLKDITDIISSNRKIDKIIIFYDDMTFVTFPPED